MIISIHICILVIFFLISSQKTFSIWEEPSFDFKYSIDEAVEQFDKLFDKITEKHPSQNYIMPLSFGILGKLD